MSKPNRILLLGGVGLVKGHIRDAGAIMVEICDALDPVLRHSHFLSGAPFRKISGIIRFGTDTRAIPEYEPIDFRTQSLPFAVEVPMASLRRSDRAVVKAAFLDVVLGALADIAARYSLSLPDLDQLRLAACGEAPQEPS